MPVQGPHISLVARALKANRGPRGPVRHLCQRSTNAQRTTYVSHLSFSSMGKDCHWSVWVERESLTDCHRLLLQMVWNQGTPQWNIPSCYSSTQGTLRHPRHSRSNDVWQWAPVQRRFLSWVCHQIWLCTHHKFTKIPASEWRSWASSPYS